MFARGLPFSAASSALCASPASAGVAANARALLQPLGFAAAAGVAVDDDAGVASAENATATGGGGGGGGGGRRRGAGGGWGRGAARWEGGDGAERAE